MPGAICSSGTRYVLGKMTQIGFKGKKMGAILDRFYARPVHGCDINLFYLLPCRPSLAYA